MEYTANQKEILTVEEVAQLLGITRHTVWRWTKKGTLKKYNVEGKKYYKYSEIQKTIFGDDTEKEAA